MCSNSTCSNSTMLNGNHLATVRSCAVLCLTLAAVVPTAARERVSALRPIVVEAQDVSEDVVCFSCSVVVRGAVHGDIVTFGGEITLVGSVTGDVVAIGGGIRLAPTAHVGGDAVASGGHIEANSAAKINGDKTSIVWFLWPGQLLPRWQGAVVFTACYALIMLVFGAILRRVPLEKFSAAFSRHALGTFLIGIVTLSLVTGLLFLSGKLGHWGNTVALILLALIFVLVAIGITTIAYWLGKTFLFQSSTAGALATGALLLVVLQLIPLVGTFLAFLLFVFAVGSSVLSGSRTRWPSSEPTTLSSRTRSPGFGERR